MKREDICIVKIKGGLGNQLFQYVFAKTIEQKNNCLVKLDTYSCHGCKNKTCQFKLDNFSISLSEATEKEMKSVCCFSHKNAILGTLKYKVVAFFEKTFNKRCLFEKSNKPILEFNKIKKKKYFDGYWQCWKYPYELRETILNEIQLKNGISDKTNSFIKKIEEEQAVFVGIRRGDYVSSKTSIKKFGTFSNEYYLKAMEIISEKIQNPIFYIFSNDIDWCKNNMDFKNFVIKYREPKDQTNDSEELVAMSRFKHAIIMNSTFHWWGAFLINNPNKIVVAPKTWFSDGTKIDIVPDEWIKIGRNGELL